MVPPLVNFEWSPLAVGPLAQAAAACYPVCVTRSAAWGNYNVPTPPSSASTFRAAHEGPPRSYSNQLAYDRGGGAQMTDGKEIERERQEQLATATAGTKTRQRWPSLVTVIKPFMKGRSSTTILLALAHSGHFIDPNTSYLLTLYS